MEPVSKETTTPRSGYGQEQTDEAKSASTSSRNSVDSRESRSDRDLKSTSSSAKTSAAKTHVAFNLSFKITIANRTPFDPAHRC